MLKEKRVFNAVNGVLVGKTQDEAYYQEYKDILIKELFEHNMFVETLKCFFTEVDKERS